MEMTEFCKPLNEAGIETTLTKKHKQPGSFLMITIANAVWCGAETYDNVDNLWRKQNRASGLTLDLTFLSGSEVGYFYIHEDAFAYPFATEQLAATQKLILEYHAAALAYKEGGAFQIATLFSEKTGLKVGTTSDRKQTARNFVIEGKIPNAKARVAIPSIQKKFNDAAIPVTAAIADGQYHNKKSEIWLTFPLIQYAAVKEGLEKAQPETLNCRAIMDNVRQGWLKRAWKQIAYD